MRWFNGLVQLGPIFLNTPQYELIEYKASQTSFVEALENRVPAEVRDDGCVYVNGRQVGKYMTFGDCLAEYYSCLF